LTQGLKDAIKIVATTMKVMSEERHRSKLDFYFGDQHNEDDDLENIKKVFEKFVGDDGGETGSEDTGKVIVYSEDYWKPTKKEIKGGDGNTPFCSLGQDGKTGTAYFKEKDNDPAMHFCPKVFSRADLSAMMADGCSALGDRVSTTAWTKNFVGVNVLHEFM
jgi:hypothetical protein